ncbi:GntR family transcriptional regulator [Latilactobacillus sakei]|uniref:GntR family transcriptional regulator n=1 Tax=Latilactobacillus sakei TaxID=1599 RepID=UPI00034036C7|nr:GntR family transcriptional regulator [Latilactobacillus sakei]EOR85694.1 transcriptional regulator, GntR family [Latilactobacillus sakei subsp. sakei LS25]PKX63976.1 GntR family transcriptional regulator [Latilactobacillus sakei]PKX68883.1 GntR family transcriptional regulator [Latilactobacillus sakei]
MKKNEFIMQDLLSKIYQNQFKDGKIPNQRELAQIYGVSRYTVQEAIKSLAEIGVIKVVQGSGMYVYDNLRNNTMIYNSLTRTPYGRIRSKMISLEQAMSTLEEQQIFQLEEPALIWTFKRLRIVDYKIEQIEISKLPVALFPELSQENVEHSIQKYVQNKGYRISHYITSYQPIAVSKTESGLLLCKKGAPAMRITNRCLLEDGRVYEYSQLTAIDYGCTYITPFNKKTHQNRQ